MATQKNDGSSTLRDFKAMNLHRGGKEPVLGLWVVQIHAYAFGPLLLLLLSRHWLVVTLAVTSTAFFLILSAMDMSPRFFFGRLKSKLAGRRRYVGNYSIRRKRFNNGH